MDLRYTRLANYLRYVKFMTDRFLAAVKAGAKAGVKAGFVTSEAVEWATRLCCESRTTYYHILDLVRERTPPHLEEKEQEKVTKVFARAREALEQFSENEDIKDFYAAVRERWYDLVNPLELVKAVEQPR